MKLFPLRFAGLVVLAMSSAMCDEDASNDGEDGLNGTDSDTPSDIARDADVCKFTKEIDLGPADEDGMVEVPPNHPDIFYMGRIDCSNPVALAFAFPGVSIRARFEGDAIDMLLSDFGNETVVNYYNVIIDGKDPMVIAVSPEQERYELARGLDDTEHAVEIFKRVESGPYGLPNTGKAELLGFRIREGKNLLPVESRPRRMEVIGDSITCGYGNEVSTTTPDDFPYSTEHSNAYNAYGAIAAKELDAEYMAVAYSGRGMVRNYAGLEGETLPQMYLKTLPEDPDSVDWDPSAYIPNLVVINLGTNDFSEGLELDELDSMRESFRTEYLKFLERLRGYYPDAVIIAALGPMINDSWPEGYNAWTNIKADLGEVVDARRAAGDQKVHVLTFTPHSAPYGEDWHPTVETHQRMARALVEFVEEIAVF